MPHRLTLAEMSRLIRKRKLSSAELVDAHWRQIERHNPQVNAFVMQFPSESRAEARRLDNESWLGPLHGIPITVKDSFDMRDLPTLCGSRMRLQHRAERTATSVSRLREAGAIILGKTNCPEFLGNWETDNYITGRTNNPWNLDCTAGGSSGGESAAIAAFCSAGGIGSDGGGSIRVPAHFCGIAGLKPTPGRISAAGHFPEIGHPGGLLGVAGPMARTAEDVRILFNVLAGYDALDPFSAPTPLRTPDVDGVRVGVAETFCSVPVEEPIAKAVQTAASLLRHLGFATDAFAPVGVERACEVWWFFFGELAAPFNREITGLRPADAHWTGTELLDMVPVDQIISGRRVVEMLAIRDRMRASLLEQMKQHRVLLMPACGVTAFRHRQRRWKIGNRSIGLLEAMAPVTPFNLMGFPAMVIPIEVNPEGMPVGVQLIGRPYEEEDLLELAVRIESTRGAFPPPPLPGMEESTHNTYSASK